MTALLGVWFFTAIFYQGEVRPLPNPYLHLTYTFLDSQTNEVFYYRENERGFCRRHANYRVVDDRIEQTVTVVDEQNNQECTLDADMQLGRWSVVKFSLVNEQLILHLQIGEEQIDYIFSRQNHE